MKNDTTILKNWQFIINIDTWLLNEPTTPHLDIYARDMKTFVFTHINTCRQTFTVVLFTSKKNLYLTEMSFKKLIISKQ